MTTDDIATLRLNPGFTDSQWFVLGHLRKAVEDAIQRHGFSAAGQQIVDLGAGSKPYKPLFGSATYLGCDLEEDADVTIVPGEPVPLEDGVADALVSFQVLEHVWDLDWYLSEARRVLKPSGQLLLSTHGTWPYHPHPTDFRRWTQAGLIADIESRGFVVTKSTPVGGPIVYGTLLRQLAFRNILSRFGPVGRAVSAVVGGVFNARIAVEHRITPRQLADDNAIVYLIEATPAP